MKQSCRSMKCQVWKIMLRGSISSSESFCQIAERNLEGCPALPAVTLTNPKQRVFIRGGCGSCCDRTLAKMGPNARTQYNNVIACHSNYRVLPLFKHLNKKKKAVTVHLDVKESLLSATLSLLLCVSFSLSLLFYLHIADEGVQRQKTPAKWNETDLDVSYERKPHHTYDS